MCSLAALSPASVRVCSLVALSPASVKMCFAGRALRQQTCFAGDCCVNKPSSNVQAPLRGVRDQYSIFNSIRRSKDLPNLLIVCFFFRRIIIG